VPVPIFGCVFFTPPSQVFTQNLSPHPYIGINQGDAAVNQFIFLSESTETVRDAARAVLGRMSVAIRAFKRFAAEPVVVGLLAVATIAVKLAAITVSNASVADALVSGSLFF